MKTDSIILNAAVLSIPVTLSVWFGLKEITTIPTPTIGWLTTATFFFTTFVFMYLDVILEKQKDALELLRQK